MRWNKPYVPKDLALFLRNDAQVVLFNDELAGQISDGVWENSSPFNHWTWAAVTAVKAPTPYQTGFTTSETQWGFRPPRRYNFCNSLLVEVCGDRMIEAVRAKAPGNLDYNIKNLKKDLRDISLIVNGRKP